MKVANTANIRKKLNIAENDNLSGPNPIKKITQKKGDVKDITKELGVNNNYVLGLGEEDMREKEQEYQADTCVVCFEAQINSLYKPCDHGGICRECAVEYFKQKGICPVCRAKVEFIVVYAEGNDGLLYQVEQYPEVAEIV